jgi:Cu/Ag efflux protein CusF
MIGLIIAKSGINTMPNSKPSALPRRQWLAAAALLAITGFQRTALAQATTVQVWKDPNCGCCHLWVEHLQANGFKVEVRDVGNTAARKRLGMPEQLGSCHTATVGGYVIEGHVPAADIHRLLKERPVALGLSVPGMPIGSPGMDGPEYKGRKDAYDVLLVQKNGSHKSFQHHPGVRRMVRQGSLQSVSDDPNALPWATGEVRRIDKAANKVALHHGEIKNLDMPPMSMVFQVKAPAQMDALQIGQKVRFRAVQDKGAYWVLQIEAVGSV